MEKFLFFPSSVSFLSKSDLECVENLYKFIAGKLFSFARLRKMETMTLSIDTNYKSEKPVWYPARIHNPSQRSARNIHTFKQVKFLTLPMAIKYRSSAIDRLLVLSDLREKICNIRCGLGGKGIKSMLKWRLTAEEVEVWTS